MVTAYPPERNTFWCTVTQKGDDSQNSVLYHSKELDDRILNALNREMNV